jgi:hypothetical protein
VIDAGNNAEAVEQAVAAAVIAALETENGKATVEA